MQDATSELGLLAGPGVAPCLLAAVPEGVGKRTGLPESKKPKAQIELHMVQLTG